MIDPQDPRQKHFCLHDGHGEMRPVWTDATNMARITSWMCCYRHSENEYCGFHEGLRPGEELITRGEYESGTVRKD